MTTPLSLTLTTQQVLFVTLNLHTVTDRQLLADIAKAQRIGEHEAEIANRTYHMGKKATPDLGYDDRLTMRLKCSPSTAYAYLGLPIPEGGLAHRRLGSKYHITEQAVRDFEGRATS
jgi:hypothetical protein